VRLFCFHHAGGSPSVFARLRRALEPRTEIVAVRLAEREAHQDMRAVVAELDERLDDRLNGEFAFYGHSMGALIAYDLAVKRQRRGATGPRRLIAGACRAPRTPAAFASQHADSDDELIKTMLGIGGMSPEILDYPHWLRPALDLTRRDLRLCASRDAGDGEPLACPIDTFHGVTDPLVSAADMAGWADATVAGTRSHRFDGGHFFFLRESPDAFALRLTRVLAGPVAVPSHGNEIR
jgi:surfactin synthase thioesterase subunit